jgi:hypothetical protein
MDILAVNPRRKKSGTKKGARKMPVIKRRRRNDPDPNPRRRRRRRAKNPTAITRRAVGRYAAGTLGGINIGGAFKNTLPLVVGALAAKFSAKKFTKDDGSEGANWTWKNYGFGLLGGFIAAAITQMIFKARAGASQKVMEGAFLLTAYKIFVNEIASQGDTLSAWFSEDETPLLPVGQDSQAQVPVVAGTIAQAADGQNYVMGQDGMWRPISEEHRLPVAYGDNVVPVRPEMGGFGDNVVPVRPEMGEDLAAQYRAAYSGY